VRRRPPWTTLAVVCLIGLEAVTQSIEVRQTAGIKIGVDRMREFGLTGAVVSEVATGTVAILTARIEVLKAQLAMVEESSRG
jgi:hypothetical protein